MYLKKVKSNKNLEKTNFVDVLKVTEDNSRIRIHNPIVRGMDPRIRIRTKISWIRKTG
jgi:hypothetical protein